MHPDLIKSLDLPVYISGYDSTSTNCIYATPNCYGLLGGQFVERLISSMLIDILQLIGPFLPTFITTKVAIAHLIKFQLALSSRFE